MSIEKLGQYLVAVEDPHCFGKVERRLVEVLVIAVCAVKMASRVALVHLAAGGRDSPKPPTAMP